MKKPLYPQQWMALHPYTLQQPSDEYYIGLANELYRHARVKEIPDSVCRDICLYAAAYLEDIVSDLRLWKTFRREHARLYQGRLLPFYTPGTDYLEEEINEEDLRFLIWNTWQKSMSPHPFISPYDAAIGELADRLMPLLDAAYEEAPENDVLRGYFDVYEDAPAFDQKMNWLFGHTYLTAPSVAPYIERVTPSDRFIIPTGPIALFLHEWMSALTERQEWKQFKGIFPPDQPLTKEQQLKNKDYYTRFTSACEGRSIVYLDGYQALRRFLVDVLGWQDDDQHTLPQMKPHRNFILMSHPEKGILLAKDICEWIADPANPLYDKAQAEENASRLLMEETLCPPDLLTYCVRNGYLPDAQIGDASSKEWVVPHADFIARHTLLYYYRGD